MWDDEGLARPVTIYCTEQVGVFMVAEPTDSNTQSAIVREDLERQLSSCILKQMFDTGSAAAENSKPLEVGDLVAVNVEDIRLWRRGRVVRRIFGHPPRWAVFLVDAGHVVEVANKDVAPLPHEFVSRPFYAREAVLAGIIPISSTVDYHSSNLILKTSDVPHFDDAAHQYIASKLKSPSPGKIVTLGLDDQLRLLVRMYIRSSRSDSLSCLNDKLCRKKYARPAETKQRSPLLDEPLFWESLPILPEQAINEEVADERLNAFSFADHLHQFEGRGERLAEQYSRSEQASKSSGKATGHRSGSPLHHSCLSPLSFVGRGRNLSSLREKWEAHRSRTARSLSVSSCSIPSCASSINGEEPAMPSPVNGGPPPLVAAQQPDGPASAPRKAALGDNSSMSLGRGFHLLGWSRNEDEPRVGRLAGSAPDSTRKQTSTVPSDLVPSDADGTPNAYRETRDQLFPYARAHHSSRSSSARVTPTTSAPAVMAQEPNPPLPATPSLTPTKQSVVMPPLAKAPDGNREAPQPVVRAGFRQSSLKALLERCQRAAPSPQPPELPPTRPKEIAVQRRPSTDFEDDMGELLALAESCLQSNRQAKGEEQDVPKSGKPLADQGQQFPHPMLQSSRELSVVEDGRVLVRSRWPRRPTHCLDEIPFYLAMHEKLKQKKVFKPKLVQAYVWEPILRGFNVAYVSGSSSGKTIGYLVPILNNLMEHTDLNRLPPGPSPKVVVVCSTWTAAEKVYSYCQRLVSPSADLRYELLTERTPTAIKSFITRAANGVTLVAATAPALAIALEEAKGVINLDRCCFLVLDHAESLVDDHPAPMKQLVRMFHQSLQRIRDNPNSKSNGYFVPRQVIATASHWTKGMDKLVSSEIMDNPQLYIASCMEAAVYGQMKFIFRRGTFNEMNEALLRIVNAKRSSRTVIFCRSKEEIESVEMMLSQIGVRSWTAHNQSIVYSLDNIGVQWARERPGSAVLLCTDDVLTRLNIRNAHTLIHYFIPHYSKYNFTFRFSLAMDNYQSEMETGADDVHRPESYLLLTKEFQNSLLTIVRLMQRFGQDTPEELLQDAIVSFGGKESRKSQLPLCHTLKAFGFCRKMTTCTQRHVVVDQLDSPTDRLPKNGVVRVRITAVDDTTRFYARLLKYWDERKQLVDCTGDHFNLADRLRKHFDAEAPEPVDARSVVVGTLYARRSRDGLYERVRVEAVIDSGYLEAAVQVQVFAVDHGNKLEASATELFPLPEELGAIPPLAVEVFLVGLKPLDRNTAWGTASNAFVREKVFGKELDGRVALALGSTLWLSPLYERKRDQGLSVHLVVMDIRKLILSAGLAEVNEEHITNLRRLCETGGMNLPDHSVGLAQKEDEATGQVLYAHLKLKQETRVEVMAIVSPSLFYVVDVKFSDMRARLESDIVSQLSKCRPMTLDEAQPGKICLAPNPSDPDGWCRARIAEKTASEDGCSYTVFFVDYGDSSVVALHQLRCIRKEFVGRLPFQAVACSLRGVAPLGGRWSFDAIELFISLTRDNDVMHLLHCVPFGKMVEADPSASCPVKYNVSLVHKTEAFTLVLSEELVENNAAEAIEEADGEEGDCFTVEPREEQEQQETTRGDSGSDHDMVGDWTDFLNQPPDFSHPPPFRPKTKNETKDDTAAILLEQTLPRKSAGSRFPSSKWWQTDTHVYIDFGVAPVTSYALNLSEESLDFSATSAGIRYELKTNLYASIAVGESTHCPTSCGVRLSLVKQTEGVLWTRFVQCPIRQPWLQRDFSRWLPTSDVESDQENRREPMCTEKYAFEDVQSDSETSDSDLDDLQYLRDYTPFD